MIPFTRICGRKYNTAAWTGVHVPNHHGGVPRVNREEIASTDDQIFIIGHG